MWRSRWRMWQSTWRWGKVASTRRSVITSVLNWNMIFLRLGHILLSRAIWWSGWKEEVEEVEEEEVEEEEVEEEEVEEEVEEVEEEREEPGGPSGRSIPQSSRTP